MCKITQAGKYVNGAFLCECCDHFHRALTDLTTMEEGREVSTANGSPNPTKYGQLHSIYDSRFCTTQPETSESNINSQVFLLSKFILTMHTPTHSSICFSLKG